MTLLGKLLAFLNLVVGLGIVSWATSVYFQRPSFFDPVTDSVEKGNSPVTFAQFKQDIDSLGKAANAANAAWGMQEKILVDVEKRRADRLKEYTRRIAWMKTGNPDKGQAGFFEAVYEKDASGKPTSVLDITAIGNPIKGPNTLPLRGADTLLTAFSDDVAQVIKYEAQIKAKIEEFDAIGIEIRSEEGRLLAMSKIRESVQAELFYLSSFEVNVYETRETVLRRKKQLVTRLTELGGFEKK